MLTPQFNLPIHAELVVDLFAGGGGASTGIEQAIGRAVDIAINHDPEAVALHQANHPQTRHFVSDVFEVDPVTVTAGQPVGLLWASPDCKHFSKAKGGKPVSKKIRSLAWVVVKWAKAVRPRVICLENVEEFQTWGPLGADNMPCPKRKGDTFKEWKLALETLGYVIEHRELRACDYGAPTIRKRLFLVARCDGQPIVWPQPTHAAPDSLQIKAKKLKPWRTAAECIDWSIPAPSIFERKKPLADATCKRIAKGIQRYVVDAAEPFIVQYHSAKRAGDERTAPLDNPLPTQTTENRFALAVPKLAPFLTEHANASSQRTFAADEPLRTQVAQVKGGHFALAVPTLIQTGYGEREGQAPRALDIGKPIGTLVGSQKHALVSAFLAKNYTGVVGSDMADPVATVTAVDHHSLVTATLVTNTTGHPGAPPSEPVRTVTTGGHQALVTANMVHLGHGEGAGSTKRRSHGIRDVREPVNTITASGAVGAVVTSHMLKLRGTNVGSPTDEPLHTISAQGTHHAEVRAFLIKYYGTDQDPRLTEPMHTVPTKDRFGLVTVHGEEYAIVDIGLRMLTPRELYRAQGFPESYEIDTGGDGRALTKTAQVRMCGNSVCPPMSKAIVGANYTQPQQERRAA